MTELITAIEPENETIPDTVAEAFAYFAKNADAANGTRYAGSVSISHYPAEQIGSYLPPENYHVTVTEGQTKRRLQCHVRGDEAVLILKGVDTQGADGVWHERSSQRLKPKSADAINFITEAQRKFDIAVTAEREALLADAALVNS